MLAWSVLSRFSVFGDLVVDDARQPDTQIRASVMLISFGYAGHMHPQHKTETLVNEMHGCFHSSATDEGHALISVAAS